MENASIAAGINARMLDEKLAELEKARAWSPRLVSKLEALIHSADTWVNYRVNPVRFATERGVEEAEAVDLFLHASKLGLYKMEWQLLCPSCGDTVSSFNSLSNLHAHCYCALCHLETQAQLDDYIQISFNISPQLRDSPFHHPQDLSMEDYFFKYRLNPGARVPGGPTEVEIFKSIGKGMAYLEPGQSRSFQLESTGGIVLGHDLGSGHGFALQPGTKGPSEAEATLKDGGWSLSTQSVGSGALAIKVKNDGPARAAFILAGMPPDHKPGTVLELEPALTGNKLLNSQTFRNLYRSDTIPGSEGIGVRDLTLLFTDLKGSTEMYERIGDLKAFALVQQHFEHLTKAIQAKRGAVVKTIGDAVMASFEKPSDALAAALEMLTEIDAFNAAQGADEIILKIGIHRGASIAVTLNERLDYFGQTVNIAARVQGIAGAEEICITEEAYRTPGMAEQLKGFHVSSELASLKGIRQSMRIYRVNEASPARPKSAAKKKKAAKKAAKKRPKKTLKAKAKRARR